MVHAIRPDVWCQPIMTGRGAIVGYWVRDRAGRFFGFGSDSRAAWEDAWRRTQNPVSPERVAAGAYPRRTGD